MIAVVLLFHCLQSIHLHAAVTATVSMTVQTTDCRRKMNRDRPGVPSAELKPQILLQ